MKERRTRLARSRSSHQFGNEDEDLDEPVSPTIVSPSAYLASRCAESNQSENQPIPSCILVYILYMMRAIGCIYLSYNYRICISHKQWSCLCLSPRFFWALSLCVCAAPPPRAQPTRVCSTYIWKIILFLIFVISFLWVSFSLFFMSFHCVLRPTFFTFRSRLCCTLHTLIQVIWLYKFWFRFEFLIHYYFNLEFIFVSR